MQAQLLRDIWRPPFRPMPIDPRWLTWNNGLVVQLARNIYETRAFESLPLLADALIDAGCTDEEILSHCQQPGPHVRGCWALDLIMDRE